jgi:hypothetical protein
MRDTLTFAVVLLAGLYLVGLAAAALLAPSRAAGFLLGFAGTARTHSLELALRGLAGGAFVWRGPQMRFGSVFAGFGWLLVLTSAGWRCCRGAGTGRSRCGPSRTRCATRRCSGWRHCCWAASF